MRVRIIDFSGFYFNDRFIIKEICMCKIIDYRNGYVRPFMYVTKPPVQNLEGENIVFYVYQSFKEINGIEWNTGSYSVDALRRRILYIFNRGIKIFVKNDIKAEQLMNFIGREDYKPDTLNDLGFNENSVMRSSRCRYHNTNQQFSYCARDNAMKMVRWFLRMNNIMYIIIHFNGYYTDENKFTFKEFSIYGLDANGLVLYDNLFVAKPPNNLNNYSLDIIENYNRNIYEKFGIEWTKGSYEPSHMKTKVINIVKTAANLKYIFVKNKIYKNELIRIIGDSYNILCLDEFNYIESLHLSTSCIYHTHEDISKNKCVGDQANDMMNWIVRTEYYKIDNIHERIRFNKILRRLRQFD